MHLIDKDPVPKRGPLNKAISKKLQSSQYTTNPILNMVPPGSSKRPNAAPMKSATPMKKPAIRQYGDKGYVPSNGKGVGH